MRHSRQRGAGKTRTDITAMWGPNEQIPTHSTFGALQVCILATRSTFQRTKQSNRVGSTNNAMRPILGSGGRAPFIHSSQNGADHTIIRRVTVSVATQHRSQAEWRTPRKCTTQFKRIVEDVQICRFGSKSTNLYCCQWCMNMHQYSIINPQ